jgi:serine/threonine protein kinase
MQPDSLLQQDIGSYRLVECIGQGGMGTVYLGRHPAIGKRVAIKVLNSHKTSPENIFRFFHEAKAVNEIGHPNLVDVLDFGETPEGMHYLIMEYLEGKSLSAVIKSSAPLPEERICFIAKQLCGALAAAHEKSIIHRDLKPDNIFLCQRGEEKDFVKLLDFGIAKLSKSETGRQNTMQGVILGTPTHMAPEQTLGQEITPAVDIYALGVILYQMATGLLPFNDSNRLSLVMKHVREAPPNPREKNPDLSEAMASVILRCLEKHKEQRYPSMLALSDALSAVLPVVPPKPVLPELESVKVVPVSVPVSPPKSVLPWALVGVLVVLLGVFGWSLRPATNLSQVQAQTTSRPATHEAPAALHHPPPETHPATEPTPMSPEEKKNPVVKKAIEKKKPRPAGTMTIDPF